MSAITAVQLAFWTPLAGALLIALNGHRSIMRDALTLLTAILLFTSVASLTPAVFAGARPGLSLAEPLPGLSLHLSVEPLGLLFALLATLMASSLLSALYLLTIPLRAFSSPPAEDMAGVGIREAPTACLLAIGITALGCVGLFFYADSLHAVAQLLTGENSHG